MEQPFNGFSKPILQRIPLQKQTGIGKAAAVEIEFATTVAFKVMSAKLCMGLLPNCRGLV